MPTASERNNADKRFGGSATATNEEPVSKAASVSKKPPADAGIEGPPDDKAGTPGDHTLATGHDHSSQTEHTHRQNQKLHGESERRLKDDAHEDNTRDNAGDENT